MKYTEKQIKLFNQAGIEIENNKDYTTEENENLKIKVTDFIMSQSSKEIADFTRKFSDVL